MIDWSKCPGVEQIPGKVSGAWLFTDTRLPVYALFDNLEAGATVGEFMEWFQMEEKWKIRAVLQHVADSLKAPVHVSSLEDTV